MSNYERELADSVQRIMEQRIERKTGKKVRIEHRPYRLPSPELASTKETHAKVMGSHCRMCLRPWSVRPMTRHHLIPVSWFLKQPLALRLIRNAHANVIPLCRPCHDRVESRDWGERAEARRYLRRSLTQTEIAFAIAVRGVGWLNLEYPRE